MVEFSGHAEGGAGIKWNDINGALLLFDVLEVERGIKTSFGEKDAVRANITVLDGPQAGEVFDDALVFPSVLVSQLCPKLGGMVLGRLGQGEKKSGQQPPWKLSEPTQADADIATAHLAKTVSKAAAPF